MNCSQNNNLIINTIILDLTTACNLNCTMCTFNKNRKTKFMSAQLLNKIFTELNEPYFQNIPVALSFSGEPLLHPELPELINKIETFTEKSAGPFWFATNAINLSEEITKMILKCSNKWGTLRFSIDAAKANTYQLIKKANVFENVIKNIKTFILKRHTAGIHTPHVCLSFIVMEENYKEVKLFVKYWKSFFKKLNLPFKIFDNPEAALKANIDSIAIVRKDVPEKNRQVKYDKLHYKALEKLGFPVFFKYQNMTNLIRPESLEVKKKEKAKVIRKKVCLQSFNLAIGVNGIVTPCCLDNSYQLKVGNLNSMSIKEIYFSSAYKKFRLAHIKGEYTKFKLCSTCFESPFINQELIDKYLNQINF